MNKARSEIEEQDMRDIFARFHNLNLLILMQDLRRQLTASSDWESNSLLCPVAHGMPDGATVGRLRYMSQAVNLDTACTFAAGVLGADDETVRRFVDSWDSSPYPHWLLHFLEALWRERLDDADATQNLLHPDPLPVLFMPEPSPGPY